MAEIQSKQLQNLIRGRHSTRMAFDEDRPVSKEDLIKILDAGKWAPTAHNMQNYEILAVNDKKKLEAISKIESTPSIDFIKENYELLSFSKEELKKKKVGILGTMFPPEWRDPVAFNRPEILNERTSVGRFIETSPILVILTYDPHKRAPASEGDFLGIMSLGCVMENMWLMAESLGIAFHIVSSLSNPTVENKVKEILGIPANLKIGISFRLGYPKTKSFDYFRIRRNIEDFTYVNQYGNKFI